LSTDSIKISAVSYLNTKPFLYGLSSGNLISEIDLQLDIPSECARKLISAEVELGLVPVATIPFIKNAALVSDFCIGAIGEVKTVCIFSEKPIEKLKSIFLDYQSRSSVLLTKILFEKYYKQDIHFLQAEPDYILNIKSETGGLVIGDRAIELEEKFPYVYDLSEAWYNMTALPFVFAAWVSNKALNPDFVNRFNQALKSGISNIEKVAEIYQPGYKNFSVHDYFSKYLSYSFDEEKKKGLELFLNLSKKHL
jgi:chorismate dehydratase